MAGWLTPRIVNEAAKGSTPLRGRGKRKFFGSSGGAVSNVGETSERGAERIWAFPRA